MILPPGSLDIVEKGRQLQCMFFKMWKVTTDVSDPYELVERESWEGTLFLQL